MNRLEIEQCNDIEQLKVLCIEQQKQLSVIGEILVDESKWHITSEIAIQKIRDYMVKNQYNLHL